MTSQIFGYYTDDGRRLTKSRFNQLPFVYRIMLSDTIEGVVHTPIYKEDSSKSYHLVKRNGVLMKMHFNTPTAYHIPYAQYNEQEFKDKYGMTKIAHQKGYHTRNDKLKASLTTYVL
jgi:hypothetical protein